MTQKRYSVEYVDPDLRDWCEYFETDSLAAAREALQNGASPDIHPSDYHYGMRHVQRRNKRRLYDTKEERTLQECGPDLRYIIGFKLLIWGVPLGLVLMLVLWGLKSCGK